MQILRLLLGWRITNPATGEKRLATGLGIPPKRINLASFIKAANQAEELVNRSAGGTERRYTGAGVMTEGDDPKTSLDALCAACCGRFTDTGGRLSLVIAHNDLAEAATDAGLFTDDVIGPFTWDPDPALDQTYNVVRGRYVDTSAASLYQMVDYPEVRIPSPDGIDRPLTYDLAVVESPSQAQRIARQVLQRKQHQRTFTAPFDIRAWNWPVGGVVPFTFSPLGFDRKLFRVVEQEIGEGGTCNMTLREEAAEIYAWDANDLPAVQAVAAPAYDPAKNPFAQAINDTVDVSERLMISNSWPSGVSITAGDAGGSTTINVSAHERVYSDRTVSVAASAQIGLAYSTTYWLYYDDAARSGGDVSLQATTTYANAFPSDANPARHYVGWILTPAAGGGGSTGGGGTPPGGGGMNPIP
ncbi:Putative phage tail protein [Sphingomonas sp. OV641]|uniref:phage tail protein n=1 Tax=Sphingomonas sp. OV641 TaxID=1881068 RepID=UPI0008B947CA|nr:phage tail protein [Sphingomonas sp. OV641]SEJ03026.1 Putative phage tail protein [Sphingomonas sp. OV641]